MAIQYWKIVVAMLLGTAASYWVVIVLHLSDFLTIIVTGILFFAVYLEFLLLFKEPLTVQLWDEGIGYIKKMKNKIVGR